MSVCGSQDTVIHKFGAGSWRNSKGVTGTWNYFSFCSRALAIFYTFPEHSVLRTLLCSKINTQNIIQGFCFYLEDKAKKLTSWLQDTHNSGVVNGSCRNLASLKSQALTVRKKFTAGRSWPTGKFEAWIRKRTIHPCFDCMQTGNRQFWDFQALAQIQCAKNVHDFVFYFIL